MSNNSDSFIEFIKAEMTKWETKSVPLSTPNISPDDLIEIQQVFDIEIKSINFVAKVKI